MGIMTGNAIAPLRKISRRIVAIQSKFRNFNSAGSSSQGLVNSLSELLNEGGSIVHGDNVDLTRYNTDWTRQYCGNSSIVVKPKTTSEVSHILKFCYNNNIPVVPQSGNTGLVGGSVPSGDDEIIMSMEKMNSILSFDPINGIITCESGLVLQDMQSFLEDNDHCSPLDLGAKGTCMIGGNISTNAGGQHFYRYGSMHANVLGLEVVLANENGTILNMMNKNRKDNTGYDLKHLFIGAEGTLGIITKAVLSCPRKAKAQNVALLACESFEGVQLTLEYAKNHLGEILSAFEMMDENILNALSKSEKKVPIVRDDGQNYPFLLLIETQGSTTEHDMAKFENFLAFGIEEGNIVDGVVAQSGKQSLEMWELRESCNPVMGSMGYTYKYDVSLPINKFYDIVGTMKERLSSRPDAIVTSWGHVIDGNLHLNITTSGKSSKDQELLSLIEPFLYEEVIKMNGSISAEHGIGLCKREYLPLQKEKAVVDLMSLLKRQLDPKNILNPGKVI